MARPSRPAGPVPPLAAARPSAPSPASRRPSPPARYGSPAAIAGAGIIPARVSSRSVAGVRVIELEAGRASRPLIERGYAPATSTATIDLAAATFEAELDALLDLAAAELNLRRLSAEVARTTRQVSALEQVVIPRLAGEQRAIAATLEQRALEDRVRVSRRGQTA